MFALKTDIRPQPYLPQDMDITQHHATSHTSPHRIFLVNNTEQMREVSALTARNK